MEQYDVNISIPPSMQSSNIVKISGVESKVEEAIEALEERVKELEKEKEDRVSFSLLIYHIRNCMLLHLVLLFTK